MHVFVNNIPYIHKIFMHLIHFYAGQDTSLLAVFPLF